MRGKRKGKQKEKIAKKENPKSKNQILLQHYFPNLCENKSKTYQNVLKKPNGVMKQERKFNKQLLTEETLIIKQMNDLFRDIFKEADHELINDLGEMLIVKDFVKINNVESENEKFLKDKDKKCQIKLGDRLWLQDSSTLSARNQQDTKSESTETIEALREEKQVLRLDNDSECSRFMIDLNDFQYNPNYFIKYENKQKQQCTENNLKNVSFSQTISVRLDHTKQQELQDGTITFQKVDCFHSLQTHSQKQIQTENPFIESHSNPSIDAFFTQMEDQNTEEIFQKSLKLKDGIKNILGFMQRKQEIKQQEIRFKNFINELKKQQNQTYQNHVISNVQSLYQEDQIDHDEIAFSTIHYNLNKTSTTSLEENNQFDILDFILHRNYVSKSQFPQKLNPTQKQIYYKQQELLVKGKIQDENSTNQKSKSQTLSPSYFQNQIQYQNQNLLKPSFDLPSQFLTGYSMQAMNPSFFRKIHEWEAEKIRCMRAIEQTLI